MKRRSVKIILKMLFIYNKYVCLFKNLFLLIIQLQQKEPQTGNLNYELRKFYK